MGGFSSPRALRALGSRVLGGSTRIALILAMVAPTLVALSPGTASAANPLPTPFFNGFEVDTTGWSSATRVASGTNGITSAAGSWHGTAASGAFTRFGPASVANDFPTDGWTASVDFYLNLAGGKANDTRFDWSVAHNKDNAVNFGRDFVFNGGFYNDTDVTGSGPRFVISASNGAGRANAYPKNPGRSPFAITSSGWYTFAHRFYNNGSGKLAVDLMIRNAAGRRSRRGR